MNFTQQVMFVMDKPPEGWPTKLSLKKYTELDNERKKYYEPIFAKYRTKKIRDYDFETGDFVGWKPIQIGIGAPIGYKYVGYLAAKIIDEVNNSNVLMQRVLKNG